MTPRWKLSLEIFWGWILFQSFFLLFHFIHTFSELQVACSLKSASAVGFKALPASFQPFQLYFSHERRDLCSNASITPCCVGICGQARSSILLLFPSLFFLFFFSISFRSFNFFRRKLWAQIFFEVFHLLVLQLFKRYSKAPSLHSEILQWRFQDYAYIRVVNLKRFHRELYTHNFPLDNVRGDGCEFKFMRWTIIP